MDQTLSDETPPVVPEPVPDTARTSALDQAADAGVALRGRAARLQAEDAADNRARTQTWRGFNDTGAEQPATEPAPEPQQPAQQQAQDQPPRRSGRLIAAAVLVVVAAGAAYAVMQRNQRFAPVEAVTATAAVVEAPTPPPAAPVAPVAVAPTAAPTPATPVPATPTPATPAPAATAVQPAMPLPAAAATPGIVSGQEYAGLMARIATLEAALGNSARLQDLSKRIDALEGKSADASTVLALSERVNTLEHVARTAVAEQTARIGQLLAVAQLREAIAAGRPYALELESVKAMSAQSGVALPLDDVHMTTHAATGIATLLDLRARFDETAGRVLRARTIPEGVSGWVARSFDRMLSLVTIRRIDGLAVGSDPEAILARAGAQLNASNLAASVTEMDALTGPAAEAAKLWLDEARARVAVESAVTEASLKTIAALGAGGTAKAAAPAEAPKAGP